MTRPNTINIFPDCVEQDEGLALAAINPGHLIMLTSTGVQKHNAPGGLVPLRIALENDIHGGTVDDAYAADETVRFILPKPGQRFLGKLPPLAEAVVVGNVLMSHGDGTFEKAYGQLLYNSVAESAEHENTTDAANFDKSFSIPANLLKAGDAIRIRGHVTVNDNNGTDTLTLLLKFGSVTVVASAALDVADSDVFYFDALVTVRTIGATGTIVANGVTAYDAAGTDTEPNNFVLAETSIDTTAAIVVAVNADWSAAHADNEASLTMLTVELNRGNGLHPLVQALEAIDNSGEAEDEAFIRLLAI